MDPLIQTFVNNLVSSQFADLKGSHGDLHLQFSEKLLNDAAKALTSNKGPDANKWLSFVHSVHVKGSLGVDLKLNV